MRPSLRRLRLIGEKRRLTRKLTRILYAPIDPEELDDSDPWPRELPGIRRVGKWRSPS